jgi:hypothetical protein
MKYGVAGLGLCALAITLLGCSGINRATVPKNDAGSVADAGDQADAGDLLDATSEGDAADAADTGQNDAGSCTPGTYLCDGQALRLCSANGVPELSQQCAATEYCDDRRALCVPQVCVPGTTSCAGAAVQVCNAAGSAFETTQQCSLSQTCSAGACLDIGCVPNTTFCNSGSVWTCGPDGTTSTIAQQCSSTQFCLENGPIATCNATACFAGDAMCNGNLATQCAPDGSGPKPGGTNCSLSNQTCYSGQCSDLVCTPGQKLCDNNSAYLCTSAGTARTLLTACAVGETCDPISGTCQNRICDPGTLNCDSTRLVTCNSLGTAYVESGTDCAAMNAVCLAGSCTPLICAPSQFVCQGNDLYICGPDGTTSTLSQSCSSDGAHCVSSGSYASCSPYVCQPSAVGCNGNVLATCAADGNAWMPGGTDCTLSNAVCVNAKCVPKVCTPVTSLCSNGNIQQCDAQGDASTLIRVCTYGTYCTMDLDGANCVPTPCLPETETCVAEEFGHCADDGMSIDSGATDCGALSEVCTLQGCAMSATDTLATSNQMQTAAQNSSLVADLLDVQSSRKLNTIEVYLSLPSSSTLVWVVYQEDLINHLPEYDLKYETTTSGSGTGFQSSGLVGLELVAGNTYAIGVSISSGNFVYYYDTVTPPVSVSFAHATGSFYSVLASTIPNTYVSTTTLYNERLTTAAP